MKTELLKLTPKEFCIATDACKDGADFAATFQTMADVWSNCQRVDWLIWILNEIEAPKDERACRLYMVWCARNTPLADGKTTFDLLTHADSHHALLVVEAFANGRATDDELSVARSAAWSAVESAALGAAWSAVESAALGAAESTVESAAVGAAWSAALSAARSAAWSAAQSAARNAAESAALSAVESVARSAAWSAAQSAALSAALSAAWSAAWSAAESAQSIEFKRIVRNPFV